MVINVSSSLITIFSLANPFPAAKKWQPRGGLHAALITGTAALLVIGLLAHFGFFNAMGTTNAAYLSYGMYGGAALLALIEIVNIALKCFSPSIAPPITRKNVTSSIQQYTAPAPSTTNEEFANFVVSIIKKNNTTQETPDEPSRYR